MLKNISSFHTNYDNLTFFRNDYSFFVKNVCLFRRKIGLEPQFIQYINSDDKLAVTQMMITFHLTFTIFMSYLLHSCNLSLGDK